MHSGPATTPSALVAIGWMMALCLAGWLGVGCAADGRDLRETQAWQTTTTRQSPPTSAADSEVAPSGFSLTSPDFFPGGPIPDGATCAGGNVFPELIWTGVPPLGIELVLTLTDQTDPEDPVLLWQVAGIEPELGRIEAGVIPIGAFETLNDYGNPGYGLPCLETVAAGTRDLQFRLYVLSAPSGVAPGESSQAALRRVQTAALESAAVLARIDNP